MHILWTTKWVSQNLDEMLLIIARKELILNKKNSPGIEGLKIIFTFYLLYSQSRENNLFLQDLGQWAQSNEVDQKRQAFIFQLTPHIQPLLLSLLFPPSKFFYSLNIQYKYYPRFPSFCLDNYIYSQRFKCHLCGTFNHRIQFLPPVSHFCQGTCQVKAPSSNTIIHFSISNPR